MSLKNILHLSAGLLVGAFAVYLLLRDVRPSAVIAAIEKTDLLTVAAVCSLSLITIYFRGLRWRLLLPDEPGADKRGLARLTAVYFMLNNVLPARMGEAARVYLLCRKNRFSLHASLGTLLVDRLIDTFFFAAVLGIPSLFVDFTGRAVLDKIPAAYFGRMGLLIAGGVVVVFAGLLLLPAGADSFLDRAGKKLWRPAGALVMHSLKTLEASTRWRGDPVKWAGIILLSFPIIFSYMAMIWLIARSLGFSLTLPGAAFTEGLIAVGVALPAAPGFVGTLHLMCREGLVLFGADRETGTAAAVLYHLLNWVPTVAAGVFFYFRMNINIRDIKESVPASGS